MQYQLLRFRLDHLCDYVSTGLLALPDFQRDFVWDPPKVVDLLQSVAKEWPIGSLLILEGPVQFAAKSIDCGPPVVSSEIRYFLLDGQQRVTSLFHAVKDLSDVVYYIDFSELAKNRPDEDFIFFSRRKTFEGKYATRKEMAEAKIIKVSDLYESENFFDWLRFLPDGEQTELSRIRRNHLYGLNSGVYNVPATVLPREVDFSALAKIFEGLNTNSVRLTTSDLLVAANLPHKVDLRKLWFEFTEQNSFVTRLDLDLLDVLKVCALAEKLEYGKSIRGLRQADLIKVPPQVYKDNWSFSCKALQEAADFALEHLGVYNKQMLPSPSNLIGLAFALRKTANFRQIRALWTRWIIDETFSQSSHTRLLTETGDFNHAILRSLLSHTSREKYWNALRDAEDKNYGSNAYLFRGVLSIRSIILKHHNKEVATVIDGDPDSAQPINFRTRSTPKKNDLIGHIIVGQKVKNAINILGDPERQLFPSDGLMQLIDSFV